MGGCGSMAPPEVGVGEVADRAPESKGNKGWLLLTAEGITKGAAAS